MSRPSECAFECEWCQKPFKYPSQLKEHIRVHTREKPYPCSFCPKAFSHSSALTQHERIHTGEKPFKCSYCDKAFSQSSNLKRHERVHKAERCRAETMHASTLTLASTSETVTEPRQKIPAKETRWRPGPPTNATTNAPPVNIVAAGKNSAVYCNTVTSTAVKNPKQFDNIDFSRIDSRLLEQTLRSLTPRHASVVPVSGNHGYKVYQVSSPLRPSKDKKARNVRVKQEPLESTSEPRTERLSGGEESFFNDAVTQALNTDSCGIKSHDNAISDSIEHFFDINGPSLSPLMSDEAFPMFVLSPTMNLNGSPTVRVGSPLTAARNMLDNTDNLHFRF